MKSLQSVPTLMLEMQCIHPFNFSSSKQDLENQVASNDPAVKTNL